MKVLTTRNYTKSISGGIYLFTGSQIRSLYSMLYTDRIVSNSEIPYVTTKDIADHLRHHLSNRQCNVFVYISIEKDLIILILPSNKFPSHDEVMLNIYLDKYC